MPPILAELPLIAEEGGKVRFEDIEEGKTLRKEKGSSGVERFIIIEHKGKLHPHLLLEDKRNGP